jgi:hypothetical protein
MLTLKNTILLTGAGFTANFGGFLARDMWLKIFNNPLLSNSKIIKNKLRNNFNFEEVYSDVLEGNIPNLDSNEREAFIQSLNDAYNEMDINIKNLAWEDCGVHQAELRKLLDFFSNNDYKETPICFTLNQDLFMERYFGWQPAGPPNMKYKGNFGNIDMNDLNSTNFKNLPNEKELDDYKNTLSNDFLYIKLHGSQKWISPEREDVKILGINKKEVIKSIPLLNWYYHLFENALQRNNIKLFIIGYSFNDEHINDCIIKAINEYHLKLFVLSTENPDDFSFRMKFKYPRGTLNELDEKKVQIWNALEGYFPYDLKRIFPYSQRHSAEKIEVFRAIGIPLVP